jgi:predicted NUDIX family phosphoesterase
MLWYYSGMEEAIERVLVVDSEWVHSLFPKREFIAHIPGEFIQSLPCKAFFMDRPEAEKDPSFRQVIPYTLVFYNGKYLTVTRLSTQTEARLHNLMSFGIGGHINPVDEEEKNVLNSGLKRELSEELAIDDPPGLDELEFIGLICSDGNDVSKVHLGLVLRWTVDNPVEIRETDKMHGEYLTVEEIGDCRDRLENWSMLVYDGFLKQADCPVPRNNI